MYHLFLFPPEQLRSQCRIQVDLVFRDGAVIEFGFLEGAHVFNRQDISFCPFGQVNSRIRVIDCAGFVIYQLLPSELVSLSASAGISCEEGIR